MDELKIGLAFSGGGFRAGSFCLGTLTYLSKLKPGSKSLLEQVIALSTISGGTIVGARYAVGVSRGESVSAIYENIYSFLRDVDLVSLALDRLASNEHWHSGRIKSLINAFADIYDSKLFAGEKFGSLMRDDLHLKHTSFNATDFTNALQFRFQWSEKILSPEPGEPDRGLIGNYYFTVPEIAAREIRMGDILASSSCFPGGFEPINFPTDFLRADSVELSKLRNCVGLMDGGVVDNQGIEPLLLADDRMKRNFQVEEKSKAHALDLVIIADVASPFMDPYKATVENRKTGWRSLTPAIILTANTIVLLVSAYMLALAIAAGNAPVATMWTFVVTTTLFVYLIGATFKGLPKKFAAPVTFSAPLRKLLVIKLRTYETIVKNRINSVLKLAAEVYMKHIRRQNYDRVYNDPTWSNRRIMTSVYELRDKTKSPSEYLTPSENIQKAASKAFSMGTTLWFTPDELHKENMLDTLIATGQFTLCWNLLEYVEKLKANPSNTTEAHKLILGLEAELKGDWDKFQVNPFWMTTLLNSKAMVL